MLNDVARGETVVVVRDGRSIARITPGDAGSSAPVRAAIAALAEFPRVPLPPGVDCRDLIDEGRR